MKAPTVDTTYHEAIAWADGDRALHDAGCVVDGGTRTHGLRGFRCERCDQLNRRYS